MLAWTGYSLKIFVGTTASRFQENGAEMHVIQAMLGHSSVTITEKHYAHFSPHYAARRAFEVLQGRKTGGMQGKRNSVWEKYMRKLLRF